VSDEISPPPLREPLDYQRPSVDEMRGNVHAFFEVARRRRSVREFSPDDVPDDVLETAIRCAATAPSGANMQPWKFVVVRDPETKRRIREAAEDEEKANYSGRMPDEWLRAIAPLETDWHKEFLEVAPALIVVFREDYHLEGDRRVQHYYVPESVGIAAGILLASLNAAGLVTLTHTPSPMGFLREILGRPANEKAFLLIPVGFPAEGVTVPRIRKKDLEEILIRK
jgi:iodotyrosine deiodinase